MAKLLEHSYGKGAVRVTKVVRAGAVHSVFEMDVEIVLEGAFEAMYTEGDNSSCVPTDTMKNTVYALAKRHEFDSLEAFALILAEHFVGTFPQVMRATVRIEQALWERIRVAGTGHNHAFVKGSTAKRTAVVQKDRGGFSVAGGIVGLEVVKTTESGFVGFLRDEFTTLKETGERIFGTSVEATWLIDLKKGRNFNDAFESARRVILEVFAGHDSLGVQQTMFAMGEAVLEAVAEIYLISFVMPNQHRILANLEPFGLTNENEIFVNTSEPFGLIRGTITRE